MLFGFWLAFVLFGIPAGILKSWLEALGRKSKIKGFK